MSYAGEHVDAAITAINTQKALQHRSNIDAIDTRVRSGSLSEIEGARQCLKECTAGIDLLKTGSALGAREVLDVLSQLRSKRAHYLRLTIGYDFTYDINNNITSDTIVNCVQQFEDATACIDLSPAHSTPEMVCDARENRMVALEYLKIRFTAREVERDTKIVLEDCKNQIDDSHATVEQKQFARKFVQGLKDVVRVLYVALWCDRM